jgi:hypothetical protein
VNEIPDDIEKRVVECRKGSRLYIDLTFLVEQLPKNPLERNINERYQKIVAEVRRAALLSQNDQRAYNNEFSQIADKLGPTVCLSGHTHVWEADEGKHWFVAKRFHWVYTELVSQKGSQLQQIHTINYGVCEIHPNKQDPAEHVIYKKIEERFGVKPVV